MNITLGFPRINEVINNTKDITTPIIEANLVQENDITAAKIVKGRIEKIKLERICKYIEEVISPQSCYIKVKLDKEYIRSSYLEISTQKVKEALSGNKKKSNLKLRENHINIINDTELKIEPPETDRNNLYFSLERLMKNLPEIIVSGINTVNRIIINKKDNDKDKTIKYMLVVEGTGLLDIMTTDGIDYKNCTSNNIREILNTLGIEAARESIIHELNYAFEGYSIHINRRHLGLISDLMTFKGSVYGLQRFDMPKMKDSVLLEASFETTNDILFNAAIYGKVEYIRGVSESIIVGKSAPIGTGVFKLFMDKKKLNEEISNRKNGMTIEEDNENENVNDDEKDFAKNKVQFNLYDMIK